ncbi:MAG TPA: hypothetical protein VFM09_14355 [Marmoricola sp.]|nr:hypothetical protein [Marmoricola sp.]
MARTVFFHIGLPKTGTTFLQTRMWANRTTLRRQGFLYPGRDRMDHFHATQVVRELGRVPAGRAGSWDRLVSAVNRWDSVGLITHEFFCIASAEQAKRAVARLETDDVRVVVTARDYLRQFPAVWQEALKMGTAESLDTFMDKTLRVRPDRPWGWPSQDLPAVLHRWAEAVPPERLHLVTVPPPGAPRDLLWQRWCEVTGIDDRDFGPDAPFANESLGAPQAALLQRVLPHLSGPLEQGPVRHRWLRQYLGHEVLGPQRGPRFGLDDAHATELRKLALDAVADIEQLGCQVHGDLADLVPSEQQPARPHPDRVPEDEVVEVASRAIEQMVRDVRALTEERDRWRREAMRLRRRTVTGQSSRLRRLATTSPASLGARLRRRISARGKERG